MKLDRPPSRRSFCRRASRTRRFWTLDLPGFGLRLREGGSPRWIAQFDIGRQDANHEARHPAELDPGEAFKRRTDMLAARRFGRDPASDEASRRAPRQRNLWRGPGALPSGATERAAPAQLQGGGAPSGEVRAARCTPHPLTGIDRRAISGLISTITAKNGASAAINAHGSLSGFFAWSIREGLIDVNPVQYTNKPKARPARDRLISETSLRLVGRA